MKHKMRKFKEGGMTDEERYGKVGAAIRRLDPEAYKNRPRTLEGNLKLLKELREKSKKSEEKKEEAPVNFATQGRKPTVDFAREGRVSPKSGTIAAGIEPDDTPSQSMRDESKPTRTPIRLSGRSSPYSSVLERYMNMDIPKRGYKKGGSVKSSASRRADGIAKKGKTRGRIV